MKRFFPLIIGLVAGLGLGTGVYVIRGGGEPAPTEAREGAVDGNVSPDGPPEGDAHAAGPSADTAHSAPDSADAEAGAHQVSGAEVADSAAATTSALADALLAAQARVPTPAAVEDTVVSEGSPAGEPPAGVNQGTEAAAAETAAGTVDPTPPEDAERTDATAEPGAETDATGDLIERPVDNEEAAKRVAKIFSQMQPRDAARVLSLMERSEVELILKQLDNRSAAKILSGLTPEQAAALSAVLIRGGDR